MRCRLNEGQCNGKIPEARFELGRSWTAHGEPALPRELMELLDSHEGTRRTVILSGVTQHETTLPFGTRGPRCHDLVLEANRMVVQ